MDYEKAGLVVCLTLFIVVGINAAIYATLSRKNEVGQIDLFRKAAHRARDPWEGEDKALKELSQMVKGLRDKNTGQDGDNQAK